MFYVFILIFGWRLAFGFGMKQAFFGVDGVRCFDH